jgi:hypothetical protein
VGDQRLGLRQFQPQLFMQEHLDLRLDLLCFVLGPGEPEQEVVALCRAPDYAACRPRTLCGGGFLVVSRGIVWLVLAMFIGCRGRPGRHRAGGIGRGAGCLLQGDRRSPSRQRRDYAVPEDLAYAPTSTNALRRGIIRCPT